MVWGVKIKRGKTGKRVVIYGGQRVGNAREGRSEQKWLEVKHSFPKEREEKGMAPFLLKKLNIL